jgi:hypothetical protein
MPRPLALVKRFYFSIHQWLKPSTLGEKAYCDIRKPSPPLPERGAKLQNLPLAKREILQHFVYKRLSGFVGRSAALPARCQEGKPGYTHSRLITLDITLRLQYDLPYLSVKEQ